MEGRKNGRMDVWMEITRRKEVKKHPIIQPSNHPKLKITSNPASAKLRPGGPATSNKQPATSNQPFSSPLFLHVNNFHYF